MPPNSSDILSSQEILPGVEHRQYQLDCVELLGRLREEGEEKALIHMATGLGKTTVIALDLDRFLTEQPDARVLFLCHRVEILNQARRVLEEKLSRHNKSFYTFDKFNTPADLHEPTFTFSTFQSMHSGSDEDGRWRDVFEPYDFDYIVVDESHHATAPTYLPTITYFQPQFLLGVTATPNRRDTKDIRSVFGEEKYVMSLADGLTQGYLARPQYKAISVKSDALINIEDGETASNWRTPIEEVVDDIKRRVAHLDNPKILVFCNDIAEAEAYAEQLDEGALAIHSELRPKDRAVILGAFHSGDLRQLTAIDVVSEGVDVPDVDVVVFARATQSESVFLQQLGRGLRKTKTKDEVLVLDYVANYARLMMVNRLLMGVEQATKPAKAKKEIDELDLSLIKNSDGKLDFEGVTFEFSETVLEVVDILDKTRELQEKAWRKMYRRLPTKVNANQVAGVLGRSYGWTAKNLGALYPNVDKQTHGYRARLYPRTAALKLRKIVLATPSDEDWPTLPRLVEFTGRDREWVLNRLARTTIRPETRRQSVTGREFPHYPPDAFDVLTEAMEQAAPPAGDWLTAHAIAELIGKSYNWTVRRLEEKYKLTGEPRLDDKGVERIHYPPSTVEALRQELIELDEYEPAGDWKTISTLEAKLGVHAVTLAKVMGKIEVVSEERLDLKGRPKVHFSPETETLLVEKLQEIYGYPEAGGWVTFSVAQKIIGRSAGWIRQQFEERGVTSETRLDSSRRPAEHYDSAIVNTIKEYGDTLEAGDMVSLDDIAERTGRSKTWVVAQLKKIPIEPEKRFTRHNRFIDHYPESIVETLQSM